MGADISIRLATEADCAALAPLLRAEDAAECLAGGMTPLEALLHSLSVSSVAWVVTFDGELAAVWGLSPVGGTMLGGPEVGIAWLLTSPAVAKHKREFLRVSRAALAQLERHAPLLVADVDARYRGALRWAKWLGFRVMPARPMGPNGEPFCPISRRSTWAS